MSQEEMLSKELAEKARFETGVQRGLVKKAGALQDILTERGTALLTGDRDVLSQMFLPQLEDITTQEQDIIDSLQREYQLGGELGEAIAMTKIAGGRQRADILRGAPDKGLDILGQLLSLNLGQGASFGAGATGSYGGSQQFLQSILSNEEQRRAANAQLWSGILGAVGQGAGTFLGLKLGSKSRSS